MKWVLAIGGMVLALAVDAVPAPSDSLQKGEVLVSPPASGSAASLALLEERISTGPTLFDVVERARLSNPSVLAGASGFEAAIGSARASGWWPDPRLSYERGLDTDMWKVTLTQEIPFPWATGAISRAAEAAARAAGCDRAIALRNAVRAVQESYWELAYLRDARLVAQDNRALLAQVVAAGDAGFAQGRDALSEVLRARSQAAQAEYDAVLLAEMAETEAARLNALLDRHPSAAIGPLAAPELPDTAITAGEAERRAEENCAESQRAREMVAEAEAMVSAVRWENLPNLELGGAYEKGGNREVMAGITLPLWLGRNAGRSAAARARLDQAKAEAAEAQNMTRAEVREALFRARNARRLLSLYSETLLPQAARAMESSQALYRQGTGAYSDMVGTTAAWYNFRLSAARARSDYGKALARLNALTEKPGTLSPALMGGAAPVSGTAQASAPLSTLDRSRGESVLAARSRFAPPGGPLPAGASPSLAPTFSLARMQALAFFSSPMVAAAEREARASLEAYPQARELSDLLSRYSAFTGVGKEAAMLSPEPGPIAISGRIVDAEVRAAAARVEEARRDAVTEAARSFWELAVNREAQRIMDAEAVRMDQVAASIAARYRAGEATFVDLTQSEGAAGTAAAEAAALRAEQGALEGKVREVLGLPYSTPVGAPSASTVAADDPGIGELERLALDRSPTVARVRAEVERMELMVQMGRREGYPGYTQNLSLSDNRFLDGAGTGGMDGSSAALMLPPPEGAGIGPAWIRELDQRLAAGREELRLAQVEAASRAREAWSAFDRARREAALYANDLAPLARLAADSALRAFEAGQADLARVIETENAAGQAELERERRRADFGIARAELIAATVGPWTDTKEIQP